MYLVGPNIRLEKFSKDNITEEYLGWMNDQINNRYVVMGKIPCLIDEITIPDQHHTLLFSVHADKYIGTASLHNIDWITQKAEIGYIIGDKGYWGKGLATEIVNLLCDYAFNRLGLNKLNADVVEENIASARVLEKNGFKKFACNLQDYYLERKYLKNLLFTKTQEEIK
jgi:ribosomal-protein-alanine N-acetyltransferase